MAETVHIYLNADDPLLQFQRDDFRQLQSQHPELDLVFLDTETELLAALPEIVWLDTWYFKSEWYELGPRLKAVITPAAGNDWVQSSPRDASVTTHYGTFHGDVMSETALALVLQFSVRLPEYVAQQEARRWQRLPARSLKNQTALILGYGHIGQVCGALLTKVGMEVWGQKRQPTETHKGKVKLIGLDDLDQILPLADHVISFLPGGAETNNFLDQRKLNLMAEHAYFYNFGRGSTVDEAALLDALQKKSIAGAALDVTQIEPLPASSELWDQPNLLILPHSSAYYAEYRALHVTELTNLMNRLLTAVV